MFTDKNDQEGGTLPKDHWIHKAMAKEKSRLKRRGADKEPKRREGDAAASSMPASNIKSC